MGEAEGGSAAAVEKPPLPSAGPGAAAAVAAAVAAAAAAAASAPEPGVPPAAAVAAAAEEAVVVWSPEVEVCLFHAMLGHKPVGVNRHFHMICIRDKFSQNIGRQISSKVIWDHLSTMYDMQALHESEILPFPNIEKNFVLPDELIQEVREGKVMMEEEVKEEIKEEMETHAGPEEVCAQEANRKSAAFPVKKPCVLRAALAGCELADWKKDSSKPESYF
uniref:MRG domain binding protein n=1 Tax=Cairina moschata TaxID=8855 RepID=A0A8C3CQK6_CAIMO